MRVERVDVVVDDRVFGWQGALIGGAGLHESLYVMLNLRKVNEG
jgi:hypothetical protein